MRLCGNHTHRLRRCLFCLHYYRHVPLNIISVDSNGKTVVNKETVLEEREMTFELDTSKPFKLNAGTVGVCGSILPDWSKQSSVLMCSRSSFVHS